MITLKTGFKTPAHGRMCSVDRDSGHTRRVHGGFRVSSVNCGYETSGPYPSRRGEVEKVSWIDGYTIRRSMTHRPIQAYRDLCSSSLVKFLYVKESNTYCEATMRIGSPRPEKNNLGSWKPGISARSCSTPSHFSAGVTGRFTSTGFVTQRSPPFWPKIRRSSSVQAFSREIRDFFGDLG